MHPYEEYYITIYRKQLCNLDLHKHTFLTGKGKRDRKKKYNITIMVFCKFAMNDDKSSVVSSKNVLLEKEFSSEKKSSKKEFTILFPKNTEIKLYFGSPIFDTYLCYSLFALFLILLIIRCFIK